MKITVFLRITVGSREFVVAGSVFDGVLTGGGALPGTGRGKNAFSLLPVVGALLQKPPAEPLPARFPVRTRQLAGFANSSFF